MLSAARQTIVGRAVLVGMRPARLYAHGTVYIPGRTVLVSPPCGCLYAVATVFIPGVAVLKPSGVAKLSAVASVRTDEEEAMRAVSRMLRSMFKEDA